MGRSLAVHRATTTTTTLYRRGGEGKEMEQGPKHRRRIPTPPRPLLFFSVGVSNSSSHTSHMPCPYTDSNFNRKAFKAKGAATCPIPSMTQGRARSPRTIRSRTSSSFQSTPRFNEASTSSRSALWTLPLRTSSQSATCLASIALSLSHIDLAFFGRIRCGREDSSSFTHLS